MKWLFPRLSARSLPVLFAACTVGSVVAGGYGIVHDQVTYTLSPEYFTKFKFEQFGYAEAVGGERFLVGKIGFQATWWVGMIAAWVLFRLAPCVDGEGRSRLLWRVVQQFRVILAMAFLFGIAGYYYGIWRTAEGAPAWWSVWRERNGVEDLVAFARVGYVHNFGYLGALVGLGVAVVRLRRQPAEASEDFAASAT